MSPGESRANRYISDALKISGSSRFFFLHHKNTIYSAVANRLGELNDVGLWEVAKLDKPPERDISDEIAALQREDLIKLTVDVAIPFERGRYFYLRLNEGTLSPLTNEEHDFLRSKGFFG